MLKRKYRYLKKPEDVDSTSTKGLSDKQMGMLKNFLLHIDYTTSEPSDTDKKTLADAYEGM